jgi:hypothetical protein
VKCFSRDEADMVLAVKQLAAGRVYLKPQGDSEQVKARLFWSQMQWRSADVDGRKWRAAFVQREAISAEGYP